MQTNNHKIVDYDEVLDTKFGKEGTTERLGAENKAYAFFTEQIIEEARKKANMTQALSIQISQTTIFYYLCFINLHKWKI